MKFDEKSKMISKKSQKIMDRAAIIIGLSLLIAGCFSFLLLEAYGQ